MGSYERTKSYRDEEGIEVIAHILVSRASDTTLYYRNDELIFSMDTTELENFISMCLSTGYIEVKRDAHGN